MRAATTSADINWHLCWQPLPRRDVKPAAFSCFSPKALQHCTDEQNDAEKFSLRLLILGFLCWKSSLLTKH